MWNIRTGSTRFTPGTEASGAASASEISTNMAFATVSTSPSTRALRCSSRGRMAFCSERRRVRCAVAAALRILLRPGMRAMCSATESDVSSTM